MVNGDLLGVPVLLLLVVLGLMTAVGVVVHWLPLELQWSWEARVAVAAALVALALALLLIVLTGAWR